MQKNSIDAYVEFSFKGEYYRYASCLALHQLLLRHDEMPPIHVLLAQEHRVDTYSYLFEVMEEEPVEFSRPQGIANDYVRDGKFSLYALADNWHNAKAEILLQPVAERELNITDLNQQPALKRALLAAYQLGRGVGCGK
ncbi:MAG: hypothetical protein A3K00_09020 [Gallionellales bacterium RIFOXYD2_FULL_52_7]|nr:MAG: hypothetical protein A3K00_09020 [Gallionellales bacterium RIFOXYD2_FULL_52_7]